MNQQLVKQLCDFVDASPTAYHAVGNIAAALEASGALRLDERESWKLEPGRAYFVARSDSGLIAFRPGLRPPAEEGFAIAGGHTDSPALKLRLEKSLSGRGMDRAAVEIYGGPIVSTWLDRPLSLAGRVVIAKGGALRAASGAAARDALETRLVNFARPVGLIPNLAIHLNRDVNKGFEYNAQNHLPVLLSASGGSQASASAASGSGGASEAGSAGGTALGSPAGTAAGSPAARLVAAELGVDPADILGADLFFVDAQKVALIGPQSELVNGYRLDDLTACHAILAAFLASSPAAHGQVACFLDHEEVGSRSIQGADSSFIRDTLGRIASLQGTSTEGFYRALSSSFSVSVDVAQAFHSSYAEKYDESFAPVLNGGPAVKVNANQRYATDAEAEARFRLLCAEAGTPCQKFMSRADMSPGSTIGPLSASITGIRTVDVGAPLLSMHSIRETVGARDHEAMTAVIGRHFASSPSSKA